MATAVTIYQGWYLDIPLGLGYVYLPALAGIVNTGFSATTFGVNIAHRLNAHKIRSRFALALCIVDIKFIFPVTGDVG